MKFIVKDKEGNVSEALEQEVLIRMVESDSMFPDTPVKNAMMPSWKKASNFDFLKEAFTEQEKRLGEDNPDVNPELAEENSFGNRMKTLLGSGKKKAPATPKTSSFKNALTPNPATFGLRLRAAVTDWIILAVLGIVILMGGTAAVWLKASSYTVSDTPEIAQELAIRKKAEERLAKKKALEEELAAKEAILQQQDGKTEEKNGVQNALSVAVKRKIESEKAVNEGVSETTGTEIKMPSEKTVSKTAKRQKNAMTVKTDDEGFSIIPELEPVKNVKKTFAPSVLDDELKGFVPSSKWEDTANSVTYVCVSASKSSARWCEVAYVGTVGKICILIYVPLILLYYGFSLGMYAQTPGMWYWGLFITDSADHNREVLMFRSYLFALLSLLSGITMPLFAIFRKQGIAERICGIRMLKIAAK